jgi:CHAD domain-containing protein
MLGEGSQMMTTERTSIRRRLAVRRTAHGPPWGRRKAGHSSIVAPLAATLAATLVATAAVRVGVALAKAERDRRSIRLRRARDRQFALWPVEAPETGLRRIALGQLDHAIELLQGDRELVSTATAVHETRKSLKRLRALVRLLEGELGEEVFAREDGILHDAGLRLAGARDAEVMLITLDALIAEHPRKLGRRAGVAKLRGRLADERRRASSEAAGDAAGRGEVLGELRALRNRVEEWSFPHREGIRTVEPGLLAIYREGAHRRRRAVRGKGPKGEAMHQWRKRVKDLRYAAEMLNRRDPHAGKGRQRGKQTGAGSDEIRRLARRADELGELLGDEHDLAVLAAALRDGHSHAGGRALEVGRGTSKELLRLIAKRRRRLRKRTLAKGERLYRRRPKRFVRRFRELSRR